MKILVELKYGVVPLPIEITRLSDKDRHDLEENLNQAHLLLLKEMQEGDQEALVEKAVKILNTACYNYINKKNQASSPILLIKPGMTD